MDVQGDKVVRGKNKSAKNKSAKKKSASKLNASKNPTLNSPDVVIELQTPVTPLPVTPPLQSPPTKTPAISPPPARKKKVKRPDQSYLQRFSGVKYNIPPKPAKFRHSLYCWLTSFIGMLFISLLQQFAGPKNHVVRLIGSQGAASVLFFKAYGVELAQPWNAIVGNVLSALIGVTIRVIAEKSLTVSSHENDWLLAPLSVSFAILFMDLTRSAHPPGGATALLAIINDPFIELGYDYLLPVFLGSVILMWVAVLMNNLAYNRQYPQRWLPPFIKEYFCSHFFYDVNGKGGYGEYEKMVAQQKTEAIQAAAKQAELIKNANIAASRQAAAERAQAKSGSSF